ncbi:MAG: hypothetical protein WCR82_02725 [Bacteroidales bacterium]|jgi:hypothetical protein
MKRILLLGLITLLCFSGFAQNGKNNFHQKNNIQSEKIAFFTSELDLTPEEAQLFWPVYNSFWKESQKAHKETLKSLFLLKNPKTEGLSDAEVQKLVMNYNYNTEAEMKIMSGYLKEFEKVLPIKKVAKLYVAEEEFRMKMIYKLRKMSPDSNVPKTQIPPKSKDEDNVDFNN